MTREQILAKVSVQPGHLETPCWIWQGYTMPEGYGQVRYAGKTLLVHRVAYEFANGPIPTGKQVDHLCNPKNGDKTHRACINAAHLEAVTQQVNIARGNAGINNASKTHCPAGHEYSRGNIYITRTTKYRTPQRGCKTCNLAGVKQRRQKAPK